METRLLPKVIQTTFTTAIVSLLSGAAGVQAQSWNLTGNPGTNPAANFLGTQDNQPLIIKTFNIEAIHINPGRLGPQTDGQARACRPHLASPSKGPVEIRQGSIPPSPAKSPMGNSVPIPSHPARCRALALCKAFNNKIPGNAEVCDKLH
jgi:hypothetical protein